MHQSTIGKPVSFSFLTERCDQYKDPKNTNVGITFEKKEEHKKGRLSVCVHMRFKYDVNFSDQTSQN